MFIPMYLAIHACKALVCNVIPDVCPNSQPLEEKISDFAGILPHLIDKDIKVF